jgi:hypothetical protein
MRQDVTYAIGVTPIRFVNLSANPVRDNPASRAMLATDQDNSGARCTVLIVTEN